MAFDDYFKIRVWDHKGATANITELLKSKTWSGSYTDCCRQLRFGVLSGVPDSDTPVPPLSGGGRARLYLGPDILFSGNIFSLNRSSAEHHIDCTAFDRGIYLKNNNTFLGVDRQTPEEITRRLCGEFGIPVGSIAATDVKLTRNFLGVSLYKIIQTLYTLASDITGKKYMIRFSVDALDVIEKSEGTASLRLVPGSNLLACTSTQSAEKMVDRVAVFDDKLKQVAAYDDTEGYQALYGIFQAAIKASSTDDPAATARQKLKDNGVKTTITADCIGSKLLITGNTVAVEEPVTGTVGRFWIISDTHTFAGGIHRTKVTLDFRNLMDEQSAGSVPTE